MAQELKHRKGWVAVKELELRRANSKGWAVVGQTSIEQEETAEVIVPDAQPDIWQVWDASTCLLLQRKEVPGGAGRPLWPAESHHPLPARRNGRGGAHGGHPSL